MAIGQEERAFFVALGTRVARLRKDASITQVQLADALSLTADRERLRAWESARSGVDAARPGANAWCERRSIDWRTRGRSLEEARPGTEAGSTPGPHQLAP